MEKITVNGIKLYFECKQDLKELHDHQPELYNTIRTNNKQLIQWALEMYLDEMAAQDDKGSTGSYGKTAEVMGRVQDALDTNSRIYLHDIRCRHQGMDDHRKGGIRYEYKTGFAQWAYGVSYDDCMQKLLKMADKGIVFRWEPFKDERIIEMPLSELLEVLATYNPKKGLKVWFGFVAAKGQLQVQPVVNSKKRAAFVESLLG